MCLSVYPLFFYLWLRRFIYSILTGRKCSFYAAQRQTLKNVFCSKINWFICLYLSAVQKQHSSNEYQCTSGCWKLIIINDSPLLHNDGASSCRHFKRQPQQAAQWKQRGVQPEFGPGCVVQQRQQPRPAAHLFPLLAPEPPAAAQVPRPLHHREQPQPEPQQWGALPAAVPGRGDRPCRRETSCSSVGFNGLQAN